jgi:hypothetical protein
MTLVVLLRAKALIWKNDLLRMNRRQQFSTLVLVVFTVYLASMILRGEVELFTALQSAFPGASQSFLTSILSSLVTFAFFWGIGTMLSQLYLSSDLELLLAAPVAPLSIYLLKLLEGMQTLVFPGALALTAWVSYGVALKSSWAYYLLASVGFLCLLVLLVAAAMSFIMFVVGLMPARRAQELYALLWTLIAGSLWAVWMIASNRSGTPSLAKQLLTSRTLVAQAGHYLAWSPAGWLASMLTAWQAGEWVGVALNLGLLLVGALVMTGLGYAIYQRAFYLGWSRLREVAPRRQAATKPGTKQKAPLLNSLLRLLPMPIRAIVAKDWITLPRDIRQRPRFPHSHGFRLHLHDRLRRYGKTNPWRRFLDGSGDHSARALFSDALLYSGHDRHRRQELCAAASGAATSRRIAVGQVLGILGADVVDRRGGSDRGGNPGQGDPAAIRARSGGDDLVQQRLCCGGHGDRSAKSQFQSDQHSPERRSGNHLRDAFHQRGVLANQSGDDRVGFAAL